MSLRRVGVSAVAALGLTLGLATSASATATYTYTGNPYVVGSPPYTTAMFISLSFEVLTPLAGNLSDFDLDSSILSFSAFDGVRTLTQLDTYEATSFSVSTDASGVISAWAIGLILESAISNQLFTCNGLASSTGIIECGASVPVDASGVSLLEAGVNTDAPGSWTPIPEPTTGLLLLTGIAVAVRAVFHRRS